MQRRRIVTVHPLSISACARLGAEGWNLSQLTLGERRGPPRVPRHSHLWAISNCHQPNLLLGQSQRVLMADGRSYWTAVEPDVANKKVLQKAFAKTFTAINSWSPLESKLFYFTHKECAVMYWYIQARGGLRLRIKVDKDLDSLGIIILV